MGQPRESTQLIRGAIGAVPRLYFPADGAATSLFAGKLSAGGARGEMWKPADHPRLLPCSGAERGSRKAKVATKAVPGNLARDR
jgi:hypothetical protein